MTWTLVKTVMLALAMIAVYCAWIALSQVERPGHGCEIPVVVEVLNGCGMRGIAGEVGEFLSDHGFDVMFVGNADDFRHDETLVVDRSGDRCKAFAVASALDGSSVVYQVSNLFFVDVTVVVGSDLAASFSSGEE